MEGWPEADLVAMRALKRAFPGASVRPWDDPLPAVSTRELRMEARKLEDRWS